MRDVQENRGIRRTGVVGVLDASEERGERGLIEGQITGHHNESMNEPIKCGPGQGPVWDPQNHAAAPNVAEPPVVTAVLQYFRGHVIRRPAGRVLQRVRVYRGNVETWKP